MHLSDTDWWSFASDDSYFTINLNLNGKEYKYSGAFKYEFPEDSVEEQIKLLTGKWKPIYYGGLDYDNRDIYYVATSNYKPVAVLKDDILEFNSDGTVYFWTNGTTEYGDIWFDGTYKLPNYNYELDRFEVTYTIKFKRYSLDKTRKIYYIDYYVSDYAWTNDEKTIQTFEKMYKCTYKYENGILYLNDEEKGKWFTFKRA